MDVIFGITVTAHSLLLGEVGVEDVEILLRFVQLKDVEVTCMKLLMKLLS